MAIPSSKNVLEGFDVYRDQILAQEWIAGISVDEVKDFLAGLSDSKFASLSYKADHPYPYLQPRGGFPTFEKQKALSEALENAGADFIPLTVDSHTRHNEYDRAGQLLARGERESKNYLNGYPLVNHGYKRTRGLYENISKPACLRHGTPDARLLVETAVASGITEIEGGALCYSLPYSEGFPVDRALLYWQYVDRVCAEYSTPDRPIHRESFGPLSATMVPPFMVIAVQLIELLLSAEQGIKSMTIGFGQTGSLTQDAALGKVLMAKAREYLDRFGFGDVSVYLDYHQWMGAFPLNKDKAGDLISMSAVIARMISADKIIIKTKEEAYGVPAIETNCGAVQDVRYIFEKFPMVDSITSDSIKYETQLLCSEVDYLMNTIFDLPGDVFWESVFQAVRSGIIDIPFAPHRMNANKLLTVRDRYNAIRIKDAGCVPISAEDMRREHELLEANSDCYISFVDKMTKDIHIMS